MLTRVCSVGVVASGCTIDAAQRGSLFVVQSEEHGVAVRRAGRRGGAETHAAGRLPRDQRVRARDHLGLRLLAGRIERTEEDAGLRNPIRVIALEDHRIRIRDCGRTRELIELRVRRSHPERCSNRSRARRRAAPWRSPARPSASHRCPRFRSACDRLARSGRCRLVLPDRLGLRHGSRSCCWRGRCAEMPGTR